MQAVEGRDTSEGAAVVATEKLGFVFFGGGVVRPVAGRSTGLDSLRIQDMTFSPSAIVIVEIAMTGGEVRLAPESSRGTIVLF